MISGFRREVDENCTLLGYYTARSGNSVQTFRSNIAVTFSRVKQSKSWPLKMGTIGCTETSVRNYQSTLRKIPKESRSNYKYCHSRTPLIRKLVIRIANYPDRLEPSGKFIENSTKINCLEVTGYRIKYSTVYLLL